MLTSNAERAAGTLQMAVKNKKFAVFVAEHDCRLVGIALLEQRGWNGALGELWWIAVEWELTRKGIGTKLLKRVEKHARSRGVRQINASTNPDNRIAIAFYLKNGYAVEGVLAKHHDGQEVLVLGKSL
jgi:ribosomal protein S18 acetylase RimI-like enzyme